MRPLGRPPDRRVADHLDPGNRARWLLRHERAAVAALVSQVAGNVCELSGKVSMDEEDVHPRPSVPADQRIVTNATVVDGSLPFPAWSKA